MSFNIREIRKAWQLAAKQERDRVQQPPDLEIRRGGQVLARNLRVLEHFISLRKNIQVTLPNRLRVEVFPAVEDSTKYAVRTIGRFRDTYHSPGVGLGGIPTTVDCGPSDQANEFEAQIAKPLAEKFGCQYGDYGGGYQNITLSPVTENQAAEIVRRVNNFDAFQQRPPPRSYLKIARDAVGHLKK